MSKYTEKERGTNSLKERSADCSMNNSKWKVAALKEEKM